MNYYKDDFLLSYCLTELMILYPGPHPGLGSWLTQTSIPSMSCWSTWRDWLVLRNGCQAIWEKFQWESSTDDVPEARGLERDQQLIAMNMCKESYLGKRIYCMTRCRSQGHYKMSMWWTGKKDGKWSVFFSFFPFEIFFGGGRLQGWWVDMEGLRNEWDCGAWYITPKESIKNMLIKKYAR